MRLDEKQRRALIDRIVQEVLHRVSEQMPTDERLSGTVVLVTSYVPSPKSALAKMKEKYGEDVTFINFGTKFAPILERVIHASEVEEDVVLEKVASAANILLLTPKVGLLEEIALGNDTGIVQHLIVRGLLWQRNVGVLLDFQPPRFKKNTFYEKVASAIGTLEEMGVRLMTYQCASYAGMQGLHLVTERDILDAHKEKRAEVLCAVGAIITPLAQDKARELGIQIN